jgi:F-type H+-transporting ATPase subunit epsilon
MATHADTKGQERRSGANDKSLQVVVVTPERTVVDDRADFVALPLYDGELGVLPGRAPLIGRLGYGELRTKQGATVHRYYVDGGFAQVRDNVVTVLTSRALKTEAIEPEAVRSQLKQAREKRAHGDQEFAEKQKAVARGRAMLRVSKR